MRQCSREFLMIDPNFLITFFVVALLLVSFVFCQSTAYFFVVFFYIILCTRACKQQPKKRQAFSIFNYNFRFAFVPFIRFIVAFVFIDSFVKKFTLVCVVYSFFFLLFCFTLLSLWTCFPPCQTSGKIQLNPNLPEKKRKERKHGDKLQRET